MVSELGLSVGAKPLTVSEYAIYIYICILNGSFETKPINQFDFECSENVENLEMFVNSLGAFDEDPPVFYITH